MAEPYIPIPADTVLRLQGISKSYGAVMGVKDISFDLRHGEILTLLGPSGCGKTTTLRITSGLERATGGKLWFNNRLIDSPADRTFIPPDKREMGMVFQSYAIWPHMSVFKNVAYPLKVRRRKPEEIRAEVLKVLNLVGLSGLEERPGTRLSGGQQQRVAVARGLVFGPDLLLMDEPFSNLDAKLRDQMRTEVKLLQRRLGISILFVTHDQTEALALSDRIAVMRLGHMEQIGAPLDLYSHPLTPAVRDFLGRTILFAGKITARKTGSVDVSLSQGVTVSADGTDHTQGAATGSDCLVAVRPEHIEVEPAASGVAANSLKAKIAALLFLGDRFEATVELPNGDMITVFTTPKSMWKEGQEVQLRLPGECLQVWLPESAT